MKNLIKDNQFRHVVSLYHMHHYTMMKKEMKGFMALGITITDSRNVVP
jgi:hypothetical protein